MTKTLYLVAPRKEGLLKGNPYSLLYLGAWVSKNSSNFVEIIQNLNQIKEGESYVGISVTTSTYQKGLDFAKNLKQRYPKIKTILGGYHTKGQSEFIIDHPEIDFVVEGEGEKSLVKILNGQTERIVFGEQLTPKELDSLSLEQLSQLNPEYFRRMKQFRRMNYISTRGCSRFCSFCASRGELTTKSTDKISEDLELLVNNGFINISIQDNYFGYNPQRIREICNEILRRRIDFHWDCQTRVESMQDESLLKLMADAGCDASYLGIENFHPEVLSMMNKTKKPEDYLRMTRNAVKNLLIAGIKPYINLQVGLYYEDETIRQTNLDALSQLGNIEIYPHLNVIYPGTFDFKKLVDSGVPRDIFESFTEWEERNGKEIKKLLRENHFIHGAGGIPLGILNPEKLMDRRFLVDSKRLTEISRYIDTMRKIKGIKFYGG